MTRRRGRQLARRISMSELLSFLRSPAAHRYNDHATSINAKKIFLSEDRIEVLRLYRRFVHQDGLTDYDLERISGRQQNSFGKRRGELVEMGFIVAVEDPAEPGKILTRPNPKTTAPCNVWRITDLGLEACEMLDEMERDGLLWKQ